MSNLKVKKGEDGKYGFVDDTGSWIIEPKFLEAYIWEELAIVHFEKKDDDGDVYDGWTFFNCDEPSENPEEEGWFFSRVDKPAEDNVEYLYACDEHGETMRIYDDGNVFYEVELEDGYNDEDED